VGEEAVTRGEFEKILLNKRKETLEKILPQWEIGHGCIEAEARRKLLLDIEVLFTAPGLPTSYAIMAAFRSYAQQLFDSRAELLLKEMVIPEVDTSASFVLYLLGHVAECLAPIFNSPQCQRTLDGDGQAFLAAPSEPLLALSSFYETALSHGRRVRLLARRGPDAEFSEKNEKYIKANDIERALEGFLKESLQWWEAEFHARRGPVQRFELACDQGQVGAVVNQTEIESKKRERKKLRDDYIAECRLAGVKVTNEMIATAANPRWHSRSQIQKWLACHPDYEGVSDRLIRRSLTNKPHLSKLKR
jgi:hypothetical protein